MGFTQQHVANLMEHKSSSLVSELESGLSLPNLLTVLRLGAIYRVPVEFLYRDIYTSLREHIREREKNVPAGQQGVLPLIMR
jgi:transcriptional regulator with XRE-family HTH domain